MRPALLVVAALLAAHAFAEPPPKPALGAFPLPAVDGKPLAISDGQRSFVLPIRFERAHLFYKQLLGQEKGVTTKVAGSPGARTLTLVSRRSGDSWSRAVVHEQEMTTRVEVSFVIKVDPEKVVGNASPQVTFVIGRDPAAARAAAEIEHTDRN